MPTITVWEWYWFWFLATLALGLVVGSFLNVCIWRMPHDLSVVNPPSHCPACKTRLRARDLVPVLSFLLQRGRCRYCGARISWRYAVVESVTAAAFLLLFLVHGASPALFFDAVLVAALIAIFAIDLEHYIIPHELNWACILSGLAREGWGVLTTGGLAHPVRIPVPGGGALPVPASVFGALFGAAVFLAIGFLGTKLFKKEAMGGGDLRL
ncbi:MAG: prepilin peptidase, partial [Armatimonadota bacterium]|nr:prepilin peptidase [Armatimonadota bacterium]